MSDLTKTHKLFIENVIEENKKKDNISDSIFQLNSKNNLISIAKETLKTRNNKFNKIKLKNPVLLTKQPENLAKINIKSTKKKIKEKEDNKNHLIFTDKEYLNFMLNDLKSISSSIEKKQRKFNPTFSNNLPKRNNFNFSSNNNKKRNNRKLLNYKKISNLKTHNYNNINLLQQIIGNQDEDDIKYETKATVTEDNMNFENLYFDKFTNEIFYKDNVNN